MHPGQADRDYAYILWQKGRIAGDMSDSLFSNHRLLKPLRPRTLADVVGQPDVTTAMAAGRAARGL